MAATNIAQEITRLTTAKADIKTAIEGKGVTVPSTTKLDGYAALVDQIEQGGGSEEAPESDVNFYDYTGFRVASYTIAEAKALTALPTPPSHEGLTFQEWNWTLNDIATYDRQYIDVGANYITTDGKTRLKIRTTASDNSVVLSLRGFGAITIEWGDGQSDTLTSTNLYTYIFSHTYTTGGMYVLSIECTGTGVHRFSIYEASNTTNYRGFDLQELLIGNNYDFDFSLYSIWTDFSMSTPSSLTKLSFQNCLLKIAIIPRNADFVLSTYQGMALSIAQLSFPKKIKNITQGYYFNNIQTRRIVFPEIETTGAAIGRYSFYNAKIAVVSIPNIQFETQANGQFANTNILTYFEIVQGWVPTQNMNLSTSTLWTADTMVKFFSRLGTTTTTITLTWGATNLNKLTADQKAVATNKGYTLA